MPDNRSDDTLLRDMQSLIDFLYAHPELPLPTSFDLTVTNVGGETLDRAKEIAKSLGTFEKNINGSFFDLVKKFGQVELRFVFYRHNICSRRVIGTKTENVKVPAPDAPTVEMVDKVVETEIVEWDCPSLLDDDAAKSEELVAEALRIKPRVHDDDIPF